jgi:hypothetical protein
MTLSASFFQSHWWSVFSPSADWLKLKQQSTPGTMHSIKPRRTGRCSVPGCVPLAPLSIVMSF